MLIVLSSINHIFRQRPLHLHPVVSFAEEGNVRKEWHDHRFPLTKRAAPIQAFPTSLPTVASTDAPSSVPSDMPSLSPTFSPTSTPTTFECATQDGYYGVIGSAEEVFTIEFGYEIEATADANIESDVLPLVEKAVTDSILGEIFTECSDRRKLKAIRRRLEITGVTQDPEDLILQDGKCRYELKGFFFENMN